jgi:hypothetical protein
MTAVMDSPQRENARTYRSTPTTEMVTDNTLTCITKWHYVWKDSRGGNSNCDFTALKAYATDDHVRLLISKFQQSGWREATKVSRFIDVRSVLAHAFNAQSGEQKAKWSSHLKLALNIFMRPTCLWQVLERAERHSHQAKMLGWRGSNLNSICRKFGFGQIPKAARNLDTRSAVLDSDNYTVNELRAIARALLEDRARLRSRYKDDTLSQSQKRVVFNRLVCNAVFLTIYYLGTGQTETLSMFLENEWVCKQSGTGRISIEGFKTRGEG